jgi:hypothetical protein
MPDDAFTKTKPFMQNFFFVLVYIISFILILKPEVEMFGLGIFFVLNALYGIMTAGRLLTGFEEKSQARHIYTIILLIVLVFSFVASVLLTMTLFHLQKKFIDKKMEMKFSPTTREELTNTEIIFITLIVCSWVLNFYASFDADEVFNIVYKVFNGLFNSQESDWVRLIFPIAVLGLGSAIYGLLDREAGILVDKNSATRCYPIQDFGLFKDHFIKAFWMLFAYVMMIVLRPFIEAFILVKPPKWLESILPIYAFVYTIRWFIKSPLGIFLSVIGLFIASIIMVGYHQEKNDQTGDIETKIFLMKAQ